MNQICPASSSIPKHQNVFIPDDFHVTSQTYNQPMTITMPDTKFQHDGQTSTPEIQQSVDLPIERSNDDVDVTTRCYTSQIRKK